MGLNFQLHVFYDGIKSKTVSFNCILLYPPFHRLYNLISEVSKCFSEAMEF